MDDAVRVDVEGDLDLRDAARCGRDADELEAGQRLVIGGHLALALQDVDVDDGLVVHRSREDLRLARGNGGVLVDDLGEDAAGGLDAERERGDVEEQDVLHLALQDAALDGRADGDHLVRVHALVRLLAEELLHDLLHLGHPGHAADENDAVDVAGGDAAVLQGELARLDGLLHQVLDELLETFASHGLGEVLRTRGVRRDEGQVDVGLGRGAELVLGALGGFLEPLQRHAILAQVDVGRLAEVLRQEIDDALVEVLAAEEGVSVGRLDLEDAGSELQDRDVEGAATEVIDGDLLGAAGAHRGTRRGGAAAGLVETVGEGGRGGLVDDAQDVEAGDAARVFRRLALAVVEVGRDSDDRLGHLLAEVVLGGLLHLREDHRGDLCGAVALAAKLDPGVAVLRGDDVIRGDRDALAHLVRVELAADEPLHREDGGFRIGDRLPLGDLTDEPLAALGEPDHGGRGPAALRVRDDHRLAAFHDCDAGVGGAEIDADDLGHGGARGSFRTPGNLGS